MQKINLNILLKQIAVGRRKLHDLWEARGHTDSDVLAASIELDKLLNQFQRLSGGVKNENPGNR